MTPTTPLSPLSNNAGRLLMLSESLPVSVEQYFLSILVGGGESHQNVNTSVIPVLCGGCRGAQGRHQEEHETGLPANTRTDNLDCGGGRLLVQASQRSTLRCLTRVVWLERRRLRLSAGSHVCEKQITLVSPAGGELHPESSSGQPAPITLHTPHTHLHTGSSSTVMIRSRRDGFAF